MLTLSELAAAKAACRAAGTRGSVGFLPTMGALHEGHLELARRARRECQTVVVSIFVNPLQFDDPADLARYPRQEAQDAALLAGAGVDLLLMLRREEMYPPEFATRLSQTPALTDVLEGAARPGHFQGVLTVVAKLFGIVGPCRAYFGRKDFQQTVVLRRMALDLELPVELVVCDTVREPDGLARSSRNVFLSAEERRRAAALPRALRVVQQRFAAGERSGPALERGLRADLERDLGVSPDYAAVVHPTDLSRREQAQPGDAVLVAARVGRVRLIDNHLLGATIGPFAEGP
ncbi:MAG: pantoate--beta-alanine ligase [Planctomycetota bacterium]